MNREETKLKIKEVKHLLSVMEAFGEGKEIKCGNNICTSPDWTAIPECYSIIEPPQYVPFDSAEEFLEALAKQKLPLVRFGHDFRFIDRVDAQDNTIQIGIKWTSLICVSQYKFYDGTPCGKLKQS